VRCRIQTLEVLESRKLLVVKSPAQIRATGAVVSGEGRSFRRFGHANRNDNVVRASLDTICAESGATIPPGQATRRVRASGARAKTACRA
jgi:hypothetical protein